MNRRRGFIYANLLNYVQLATSQRRKIIVSHSFSSKHTLYDCIYETYPNARKLNTQIPDCYNRTEPSSPMQNKYMNPHLKKEKFANGTAKAYTYVNENVDCSPPVRKSIQRADAQSMFLQGNL